MAINKVLVSRYKSSSSRVAEVGTSYNGRFTPIGTGLPTSCEIQSANYVWGPNCKNRVIEFEGELYAVQRQDIYKYNNNSGEWELDHAAGAKYSPGSAVDFGDSVTMGLYVSAVDGVQYLNHIWATSKTNGWRSVRKKSRITSDGQYESEVSHTTPFNSLVGDATFDTSSYNGVLDVIEIDGTVYAMTSAAGNIVIEEMHNIITYNLISQTLGQIQLPSLNTGDHWGSIGAIAGHNGRLFFLGTNATSISTSVERHDSWVLCEIIGSTMSKLDSISNFNGGWQISTYTTTVCKPFLFGDEEFLYVGPFVTDAVSNGYSLFKYDTSSPSEAISHGEISGVLPDSMSRGAITENSDKSDSDVHRISIYTQVDHSGNTEIIFAHNARTWEGSPGSFWKWKGDSQHMKYLGVGHGTEFALPSFKQGGGAYIWSEYKELQCNVESISPSNNPGCITINYRFVNGTGQPVVAKFLYDNESSFVNSFATLLEDSATPSGIVASGTSVGGLIADSGILYSVDWMASDDGINSGDGVVISPVSILGNLIP